VPWTARVGIILSGGNVDLARFCASRMVGANAGESLQGTLRQSLSRSGAAAWLEELGSVDDLLDALCLAVEPIESGREVTLERFDVLEGLRRSGVGGLVLA
jgi:hypothetical protein